mmetsp:Transcript_96984/g.230703  ORF Transcript_96984/g.230703 Transcript_96984/m.230703 type:complete len:127 (-) Transcript_96984:116-496(-)
MGASELRNGAFKPGGGLRQKCQLDQSGADLAEASAGAVAFPRGGPAHHDATLGSLWPTPLLHTAGASAEEEERAPEAELRKGEGALSISGRISGWGTTQNAHPLQGNDMILRLGFVWSGLIRLFLF